MSSFDWSAQPEAVRELYEYVLFIMAYLRFDVLMLTVFVILFSYFVLRVMLGAMGYFDFLGAAYEVAYEQEKEKRKRDRYR